jgi:hypothetical protein
MEIIALLRTERDKVAAAVERIGYRDSGTERIG